MNNSREGDSVLSEDDCVFEEEDLKASINKEQEEKAQQKEVETEIQEQKDFDHF